MKPRNILGIFVLLFTITTALASTNINQVVYFWDDDIEQNVCLSESIEVYCGEGSVACFEDTSIGYRYLYSKSNCTEVLGEQSGFVK